MDEAYLIFQWVATVCGSAKGGDEKFQERVQVVVWVAWESEENENEEKVFWKMKKLKW